MTHEKVQEILKVLPHRFPFLLVDRVLSLNRKGGAGSRVGDEITVLKNITFNEPQFQGHFPDFPIMPGVLVVEAMAQSCGLLGFREHPTGGKWNFFILGIDKARFRKQIIPGDSLEIHSVILKDKGAFLTFQCKVHAGGELKAEAEIFAQMSP